MVYADDPKTLPEALRLARLASAQAPGNPLVLDTLGWVQYRAGDFPEALKNLEEANRLLPSHPEIAYHLAAAYAKLGKTDRARPLLEEALDKAENASWAEEARKLASDIGDPSK
jgi:tetratricopeptide (TPR) repeat protein